MMVENVMIHNSGPTLQQLLFTYVMQDWTYFTVNVFTNVYVGWKDKSAYLQLTKKAAHKQNNSEVKQIESIAFNHVCFYSNFKTIDYSH